jgi:ankyrin repeat protein
MSDVDEILAASERGDAQRVRQLLAADPRLANVTGHFAKTPLHLAAEHDHAAVAAALLAAGARLEAETTWRQTPLEWAANQGNRAVAEVLLGAGAQLHLWAAAGLGMMDAVEGFWEEDGELKTTAYKPELHQQPDGSWLPDPADLDDQRLVSDSFYIACRNGHTEVARFLLERGADLNFRGFFGATALHWAAINGHRETVEFLLARGARTDLLDERHHATPRQWALEGSHQEIAERLAGS